jgi:hypothetical protein
MNPHMVALALNSRLAVDLMLMKCSHFCRAVEVLSRIVNLQLWTLTPLLGRFATADRCVGSRWLLNVCYESIVVWFRARPLMVYLGWTNMYGSEI